MVYGCSHQSDEEQIITLILDKSNNPKLINQVTKYHGSVNIVSLVNDDIANSIIQDYGINNYLTEEEVLYLTSPETLDFLSSKNVNRGLWTEILQNELTFEIIDRSAVNNITPDKNLYPLYAIAYPRFDKKKNYAFVYAGRTAGFDIGGSIIYFFKNEKGKWTLVKSFEQGFS